jgi:uncharacterized membrane protein YvbJ
MPYCHVCGAEFLDDALFCPNCGTRVSDKTGTSGTGTTDAPADEVREAFNRMSLEMEKAFNIAAKEIQSAFETARNNIQKTMYKAPVVCPNCGENNPASADYCYKCGKRLNLSPPEQDKESKTSSS